MTVTDNREDTNYNNREMEQSIYNNITELLGTAVDVDVSYNADMGVEHSHVILYRDDGDTSVIDIEWLRKFNILPQYNIKMEETKSMENDIIRVIMPLNGERIVRARL